MDFPGRLISGILAVLLILIFPLQYIAHSHSENIDSLVDEKTHRLTDDIRSKGYLDIQMYEDYINFLDTTGERYDLNIQDIRPVKGEEITNINKNNLSLVPVSYIKPFSAGKETEILINVKARYRKSYDEFEYYNYLYISKDNGETWSKIMNLSGEYFTDQRFTFGPDGHYYFLKVYSWNYVDYYTHVVRYDSQNNTQNTLCTLYYNISKYKEIIFVNDKFFITPNSGSYIMYSNNAQSFSNGTYLGSNITINNIVYGNNVYVAAGREWKSSSGSNTAVIYYSSNGIDWTKSQLSISANANVIFTGDMFIAGLSNGYLYYSYNGINWTSMGQPTVASNKCTNATKLAYGKNTLIISDGNKIYITKNNGKSYELTNLNVKNVYFYNGYFYGAGSQTNYNPMNGFKKSRDGITWEEITLPLSFDKEYLIEITNISFNNIENSAKQLVSITVSPTFQTIQKYSNPLFTVKAIYSDETSRILSSDEYSIEGFDASKIGTQNINITYSENGITRNTSVSVTVTPLQRECPICHNTYELNPDDTDPGCPYCKELITGIEVTPDYIEVTQGDALPVIVTAKYKDGSREIITDWISNYNPEKVGLQIVTIEYGGYAKEVTVWVYPGLIRCPVCDTEYPATEDNCPVCAAKVVSISVEPKELTVMQYDPISLEVTAYFANGDSRIVDDWSIDVNTDRAGTYIATVSYKGVSANIKLNVLSIFSIECPICGLRYNISDSPKGCPVCSEELVGIEAYLTSGSNIVQLGAIPSIAVILIYRDNHREFAYEGFTLENFNPNILGVQTATVRYKEFSTTIIINVVNTLDTITCPNGHVYYKNADGTDPGCPYCKTAEDISTVVYFDITYTSEILKEIYANGKYYFKKGNYLTLILIKKDKSLFYKIQNTFFKTSLIGRKKKFVYGGNIY